MKFVSVAPVTIDAGSLIESLLGINPSLLASSKPADVPQGRATLLGLGSLMRQVLELTLQLGDRQRVIIVLRKPEQASRAYNLAMLLTWGLTQS